MSYGGGGSGGGRISTAADAALSNPATNDVLVYDATLQKWQNAAISQAQVTNLTGSLAAKAPLASPAFTGTPTTSAPVSASSIARLDTIIAQNGGYLVEYNGSWPSSRSAALPYAGYTGRIIASATDYEVLNNVSISAPSWLINGDKYKHYVAS